MEERVRLFPRREELRRSYEEIETRVQEGFFDCAAGSSHEKAGKEDESIVKEEPQEMISMPKRSVNISVHGGTTTEAADILLLGIVLLSVPPLS